MDRSPLFPGTSCFPLSPSKSDATKRGGFPHSHTDQLNVIFSVIGTPQEDKGDLEFVTDSKAIEYLKSFVPKKRIDFRELFPGSSPEAIDFLGKCLQFNPKKRMTLVEALKHPVIDKVRDSKQEILCKEKVIMDFEKEGDLSEARLRELFLQEIHRYKK
eukprot:TRINITY_DN3188_c0_g1_i6.p1 TRINITY_DN3188_c0_g1~~TRINITY_DN3188_c0_g1_i6.p1  ORF type:complete len:159 (-),score=22.41 TRINITY_DN3188_c0_g1_i6:168-644(-)